MTGARRQRVFVAVAVAAAMLSTAGLLATSLVKSPQQVVAESRPPTAEPVTAPVERRIITDSVLARGTVTAGWTVVAEPMSIEDVNKLVITSINVRPGARIRQGAVLVEVSGRPVVALRGRLPAYRDLHPGDRGPDVGQLQRALQSAGFPVGEVTGVFDAGTKRALAELYHSVGYEPQNTGPESYDAVTRAVNRVAELNRQILAAQSEAADAHDPRDVSLTARYRELSRAQRALAELEATTGPVLPMSEVLFVPQFPARVAKIGGRLGDQIDSGPVVAVSSPRQIIRCRLNPSQAGLVDKGMTALVDSDLAGIRTEGEVRGVGAVTTDQKTGERYVPILVEPLRALRARATGQDVRVSVETARSESPVLVVPVSAVLAAAEGQTFVSRYSSSGAIQRVPVEVGMTVGGFAEVRARQGLLQAGNRVVVGR